MSSHHIQIYAAEDVGCDRRYSYLSVPSLYLDLIDRMSYYFETVVIYRVVYRNRILSVCDFLPFYVNVLALSYGLLSDIFAVSYERGQYRSGIVSMNSLMDVHNEDFHFRALRS